MKKYTLTVLSVAVFSYFSQAQVVNTPPNSHVTSAKIETTTGTNISPTTGIIVPPGYLSNKRSENTAGASANNNCASPTTLTVGGSCVSYNNSANSMIGNTPTCASSDCPLDQWFIFKATASDNFVRITGSVGSCKAGIAIYGPYTTSSPGCPAAGNLLFCSQTVLYGINDFSTLSGAPTYTVGDYYLIQVWDLSCHACNGSQGTWCISVQNTVSCSTCASPCGKANVYNSTTVPASWAVESPKYALEPMVPANTTSPTYCFTVQANNTTDQVNMGSAAEGGNSFSAFNWTLYSANCGTTISSGSASSLTTSGVKCDTSYVLCITFQNAGIVDSISPYLYNATSTCTVLPIQLIDFGATYNPDNNSILFHWSTATEVNNKMFTLQKSADGMTWNDVTNIAGAGTSDKVRYYTASDENPYAGMSYYRLIQTDFDGTTSYPSQIIPINIPAKYSVNIYPNPTSDNLTLQYGTQSPDPITVVINDLTGHEVANYTIMNVQVGLNEYKISTSNLAPGMYFIRVSNPQKSTFEKFIKN